MVRIIYRPRSQGNFLKVLNNNMNKIDSVNNEIYILGDFNINLHLNDSYILAKKNILNNNSVPIVMLKATMNFVNILG